MSRRESRDSDARHHRSKVDREPSPKRPRRDGKPATERPASNLKLEAREHSDGEQKHRRRLQDVLPLEAPSDPVPKAETGTLTKESDKKINGHREGTKHSSDPTEPPLSRSFSQVLADYHKYAYKVEKHNERGNAGQAGRSSSHKETTEHGWWGDSRYRQSERGNNRRTTDDSRQRDEKSHSRAEDSRTWRHDGYSKVESDSKPPARKRPSFREKKIPVDAAEVVEKEATEPTKPSHTDTSALGDEKKEERRNPFSERPKKSFAGERESNHRDLRRGNYSSRDRQGTNGGGGFQRGRERFGESQGQNRPSGGPVEKWKHDLFDEANRSPTRKNEEDQIAKVEALLASS